MPLVPISCTKKRRHVDRLNNKRESPWISGNFKWTLGVSASQSTELLFWDLATAAAKSLQSCPTLCNPIDSSPPGSSAHEIFQARVLEWGAMRLGPMTLSLHKSPFTWLLDRSRKWNWGNIGKVLFSKRKMSHFSLLPVFHSSPPKRLNRV